MAYDTTLDVLKIYDGANWDIVGAPVDDSTLEISSGVLQVKGDGITGTQIADNAIDSEHYTDGSIDTAHIGNDQVTADKLADTAVTAGSYTAADITVDAQGRGILRHHRGTISSTEIADDAVGADQIADNSVDIARLNVTDGTNGQVLSTNGSGTLSFVDAGTDVDVSVGNLETRLSEIDSNVTIGNAADVQVTTAGKLVVTGDLVVNGTTTTVNSSTITSDDPIFTLGGDTAPSSDDNKDRGIEFRWHNGSAAKKVGFFGFDDSSGKFTFIPDATNTSEVFSGSQGTIAVGGIDLGGTAISATAAEINLTDGGSTIGTTALADGDGFIHNDGGTMKQTNVTKISDYVLADINGGASTIKTTNLTASRALVSNSSGKVAVSAVTSTELGYLDGVTSSVQTQIETKSKYYTAEITTVSNTLDIGQSTHGVRYPANVQLYDASNGQLVLVDIVQSTTGENDITINAPTGTYDIVIVGRAV